MKRWLVCFASVASLAGCIHVPEKPPEPKLPLKAPIAGLASESSSGARWPEPEWWKRYQDPTLDEIVRLSLASSPSLSAARSRFDIARASVREIGAAVGARVGLQADLSRQRLSDNGLFPPELLGFNWYNQADLGLQASYTFDWWGKQRSAVRAAVDTARAREAETSAAHLTLVSSIVDTYFGWQADQARLQLAHRRVANAERREAIEAARVRAELDSPDKVREVHSVVGDARDQIAGLEGSAKLRIVALAALAGLPASELPRLEAKELPAVPLDLPDNVGIDLLSRRADITASKWRVEAARSSADSARADFYPDVSLNALAGLSSVQLGRLLQAGSSAPSMSAALHLPIFDAGRLSARYGSTRFQLNSAVADYEDAVNNAAKDVATQVTTRQQLLAQRTIRTGALADAQTLYRATQSRARAGLTDLRPQLEAEQNALAQQDALLQLHAAALSVDVALQRALGGGYDATVTSTPTLKTP
jgi:outer membrane protein, multidrug efflux system